MDGQFHSNTLRVDVQFFKCTTKNVDTKISRYVSTATKYVPLVFRLRVMLNVIAEIEVLHYFEKYPEGSGVGL